jgi:hypothetical protein
VSEIISFIHFFIAGSKLTIYKFDVPASQAPRINLKLRLSPNVLKLPSPMAGH